MQKRKSQLKKVVFSLSIGALGIVNHGCFGEFAVTKAVYNFHKSIGGEDKMGTVIRSIPLVIPIGEAVYTIAVAADIIVFNTVEFWTGTNPLAFKLSNSEDSFAYFDNKSFKFSKKDNRLQIEAIDFDSNQISKVKLKFDPLVNNWLLEE